MIVMVTQKPECGKAAYPREERTSEMGLILEEERHGYRVGEWRVSLWAFDFIAITVTKQNLRVIL